MNDQHVIHNVDGGMMTLSLVLLAVITIPQEPSAMIRLGRVDGRHALIATDSTAAGMYLTARSKLTKLGYRVEPLSEGRVAIFDKLGKTEYRNDAGFCASLGVKPGWEQVRFNESHIQDYKRSFTLVLDSSDKGYAIVAHEVPIHVALIALLLRQGCSYGLSDGIDGTITVEMDRPLGTITSNVMDQVGAISVRAGTEIAVFAASETQHIPRRGYVITGD